MSGCWRFPSSLRGKASSPPAHFPAGETEAPRERKTEVLRRWPRLGLPKLPSSRSLRARGLGCGEARPGQAHLPSGRGGGNPLTWPRHGLHGFLRQTLRILSLQLLHSHLAPRASSPAPGSPAHRARLGSKAANSAPAGGEEQAAHRFAPYSFPLLVTFPLPSSCYFSFPFFSSLPLFCFLCLSFSSIRQLFFRSFFHSTSICVPGTLQNVGDKAEKTKFILVEEDNKPMAFEHFYHHPQLQYILHHFPVNTDTYTCTYMKLKLVSQNNTYLVDCQHLKR